MQKEMEAETVDYIEWKTGTRVEGIMLSIMYFTGKIENSFSAAIGYLLMLIPMAFYNISGKSHHMMIEELKERHEAETGSAVAKQ